MINGEPLTNREINANPAANLPIAYLPERSITGVTFQKNSAKFYVLIVNFSINGSIKVLENINQRFKRTISWTKYRTELTTPPISISLDYTTDPTTIIIDCLFFHLKMVT